MIVHNNQQQLTRLCSFQEYFVLLRSPPRNNGNQGQHAIIHIRNFEGLESHVSCLGMTFQFSALWQMTLQVENNVKQTLIEIKTFKLNEIYLPIVYREEIHPTVCIKKPGLSMCFL